MGINKFTAFTQHEFEEKFMSKIDPQIKYDNSLEPKIQDPKINIDWVSAGAVSPVKNQGSCIASYAFSAVGGIEGVSVIFLKAQVEYSVQQIIDCTGAYGNQGCTTGTMTSTFKFVTDKGKKYLIKELRPKEDILMLPKSKAAEPQQESSR